MIAAILTRIGLGVATPYLVHIIVGGAILGGGVASWLVGWTDWQTAGLLVLGLMLAGLLAATNSKAGRIGIALVVGAVLYLKGRIDENLANEGEVSAIVRAHVAEIKTLKDSYSAAAEAEKERQTKVGQAALAQAEQMKANYDEAKAKLAFELDRLKKEAANAPSAEAPVFDAVSIARLNRLRHAPAGKPGAPGRGGKAKNRKVAVLGSAPLSASSENPDGQAVGKGSRGGLGRGHETLRGMPVKTAGIGQACGGPGCGVNWWTGF